MLAGDYKFHCATKLNYLGTGIVVTTELLIFFNDFRLMDIYLCVCFSLILVYKLSDFEMMGI